LNIYICIYVDIYMCICISICILTYSHVYVLICLCKWVHIHIHSYTYNIQGKPEESCNNEALLKTLGELRDKVKILDSRLEGFEGSTHRQVLFVFCCTTCNS